MGSPDRLGEVLAGRYRVERVIGEGGMGLVLAAQHMVLGERVALKVLLPSAARNQDAVARFQREAQAAARIPSEHVVRVMDVGSLDDGTPYLVMEYVEGRDLSAELDARGPLPISEAVDYILQAAIGVSEAHALGIVHRDLKPSNLFLARLTDGRTMVKVLDFGIAKVAIEGDTQKLTKSFSALGSISYMSPEQLRTAKDVDARADVWAFGVLLFELLTGKMPFNGETITAIASSITVDQPIPLREFRPDAHPALETIILRCLEKDRRNRIRSVAELGRALAPFGGPSAVVHVARIVDIRATGTALESSEQLSAVSGQTELAFSPPREARASATSETLATGPSWTTSEEAIPATVKEWKGRRMALLVGGIAGVALLALASGIAWSRMRAGVNQPPAASSIASIASSETSPLASVEQAPPPGDSATAEPSEPAPSASAPSNLGSSTATRAGGSSNNERRSGKKSEPTSRKVKKPLLTDL